VKSGDGPETFQKEFEGMSANEEEYYVGTAEAAVEVDALRAQRDDVTERRRANKEGVGERLREMATDGMRTKIASGKEGG
jgi:hypothetical protein